MAMFDFFGSQKDEEKRRELEENIAQIREKVQQEERQQSSGGGDYREPVQSEPHSAPQQPPQTAGEEWDEPSVQSDSSASQQPPADDNEWQQEPAEPEPQSPVQETEQSAQSPPSAHPQPTGRREQDAAQGEQRERQSRMSMDDVPQPPEVKDLDIPDITKGPLFITVNKFKDALTTLSEMKHMVADLESSIGSLENTLEEDRETEESLREILDTTITDTEIIQNVVTPESDGS